MAQYLIQILNNSGVSKNYVAFMKPPIVTSTGGNPQVYSNAWVTFTGVTNGGFDTVTYDDITYAYWSTTPSELAPGTIIDSGGTIQVNTATSDTVPFTGATPTGFGQLVTPGSAMSGSYSIVAGTDFTPDNGYIFGLAKAGKTPIPAPVATFAATPNDTFNITPVVTFYVADGAYAPGQLIDVSTTSTLPATIDFTGKAQTTATVIQQPNGSWTVDFS
jgi:hypothetical protein